MYGICLLACLGILASSCQHLLLEPGSPQAVRLPVGLPWTGAHFRIDALAAFFLAVVNLGGAGASLFAIGYGRHEVAPGRVLPFYPLFLAGMNLVVLADDAFSFLAAWEFMSLSSWALVVAHHHDPENTRAGYIYILMASFGTLALLLAFGLLAGGTGGYTFAEMRAGGGTLPAVVLILALLGAGSKAGLVPLHVWLPLAHPAAPSHVSALMSGVMTKVAVYGFIRIVFDLNGGSRRRGGTGGGRRRGSAWPRAATVRPVAGSRRSTRWTSASLPVLIGPRSVSSASPDVMTHAGDGSRAVGGVGIGAEGAAGGQAGVDEDVGLGPAAAGGAGGWGRSANTSSSSSS